MKLKESIKQLIAESKQEWNETKEIGRLVWIAKKRELTHEECLKIKNQSLDVFRVMFLSGLFIVPGSGLLILFLVKFAKRFGFRVLPSSFDKK